jgi:biotin synthase
LNKLIPIVGTPLADKPAVDSFEFIRVVAVARVMLPLSMIRLSAGRDSLSEEAQALCFFAGANSIHNGEKLLTTDNISPEQDNALLKKLGLTPALFDTELKACH